MVDAIEMDSPQRPHPHQTTSGLFTWWDRLLNAARIRFGSGVKLVDTANAKIQLEQFVSDLQFTVVSSSPEPSKTRPTIIDLTSKEFVNFEGKENDESIVRVVKNSPITDGIRYKFFITEGVSLDHKRNLGFQIVSLSMAGGYMRVGTNEETTDRRYNEDLQIHYSHEEKLIIPPRVKVTAVIKTYVTKHKQDYTLEFRIRKNRCITVNYLTKCQQRLRYCCCFCCCRSHIGHIFAADLLQTLPNFRQDDDRKGYCYFTLDGVLTWIGEGCSVEKSEQPV